MFVKTHGSQFSLQGNEFRFSGANNYYLGIKSKLMADDVIRMAHSLNLTVLRIWGFCDDRTSEPSVNFHNISTSGVASYKEGPNGLERLDYAVYAASKAGIRLIVTLVNNWEDYGGIPQYMRWLSLSKKEQFFTEDRAKAAYKNWVSHLLHRENIFTKRAYKDEPTIMAWELINEPRLKDRPTPIITDWVEEMSKFVKQYDPNHLVAVGDEGFINRPTTDDWTRNGSEGVDFEAFLKLPSIDFGTFHLYPDAKHWNRSSEWGLEWIRDHAKLARSWNKPVILEEYGYPDKNNRPRIYKQWLEEVYQEGLAGDCIWMIAGKHNEQGEQYPDYDGFTLHEGDPILQTLHDHALRMSNSKRPLLYTSD